MPLTDAQLTELYDKVTELHDKQALHENLMLYVRGADRHDRELIRSTYWEDSWDDHGSYVGSGHGWADEAVSYNDKVHSCNHHVSNVLCEIDGNQAKRESMFLVVVPQKEPDVTMFLAGRYRDLCEKRNGVWKILHRTCVWDWLDIRPINSDWDFTVPPVTHWGAWYPNDPIYLDWVKSLPTERSR